MILTIVVLALMLVSAVWTVLTRGLIRAALGLGVTSVFLTLAMFMMGAGLAAVFELSVCAGLITVVFVSTIAMTKPRTDAELMEKTRKRMRRYWYLPLILVAAGALVAWFGIGSGPLPAAPASAADEARKVLWGSRRTDLVGQVLVILAGTFGVIVLFKERKK